MRVTARGYDGETNARNEERWQKVVVLYKRLLITCLQFLHNFIMHNEHRKLVLWLDLFGNQQQNHIDGIAPTANAPETEEMQAAREARIKATVDRLPDSGALTDEGGLGYNIDDVHALFDLMSTERPPDGTTQEAARQLMDKIRSDMERLSGLSASQLDENPEALLKVGAALRAHLPAKDFPLTTPPGAAKERAQKAIAALDKTVPINETKASAMRWADLPDLSQYGESQNVIHEITADDTAMPRTAESAAETLQEAKDELLTRLNENATMGRTNGNIEYDPDGVVDEAVEDDLRSTDGVANSLDDEEEDDEDEDYRQPGDQERGLLTDVPLVLGPTEIEALPMIIQAGVVDSFGLKGGERNGAKNMQAVRCHILLAQESGRNVLRELLIFIAAWDLPDDEFYFKMMVQIMEAILKNGLMSHAYSDFGQAKDIISPAQAVVIKILTHIFRKEYSPPSVIGSNSPQTTARATKSLTRVDVLTVRYIFTVFRGNIIPETCALIYLQGRIRSKQASAEDFPLNLWDMERVYEGVYQFLEFFAVLTESNDWKSLLVDWEIVYDLVTLIKELDQSIPKASLKSQIPAATNGFQRKPIPPGPATTPMPDVPSDSSISATPVAVERPYDPVVDGPDGVAPQPAPIDGTSPPLGTEDPSEFEWRNLKKLIVLVLSSLVWKSKNVQDQIRQHGGVDVILQCTQYDAHNPYIKEHAVMCLKFLLEGNKENQDIVRSLEAQQVVGDQEVLEDMGLQASVDEESRKVRIERRRASHGESRQGRRSSESTANLRERLGRMNVNGGAVNGVTRQESSQTHSGGFVEEIEDVVKPTVLAVYNVGDYL